MGSYKVRGVSPNPPATSSFAADQVERRRKQLGLSPGELATQAGYSTQALLNLRNGVVRNYRDEFKREVCRVLRWSPQSIDRIFAGKPAIPSKDALNDPLPLGQFRELRTAIEGLSRRVADVVERVESLEHLVARLDPPARPLSRRSVR